MAKHCIHHAMTPCTCVLSHVQLFATPWTVAHQAPLSTGFSQQEYWSGLPLPPLGDLTRPRDQTCASCVSRTAGGFFATEPTGTHTTQKLCQKKTLCTNITTLSMCMVFPTLRQAMLRNLENLEYLIIV